MIYEKQAIKRGGFPIAKSIPKLLSYRRSKANDWRGRPALGVLEAVAD
jgi:hypothetical protein